MRIECCMIFLCHQLFAAVCDFFPKDCYIECAVCTCMHVGNMGSTTWRGGDETLLMCE